MFSNRLLFNLKISPILYLNFNVNSFSKICASNLQFKHNAYQKRNGILNSNKKISPVILNSCLFATTDAKPEKTNDENPVDEEPLSIIAKKQAEFERKKIEAENAPIFVSPINNDKMSKIEVESAKTSIFEPYIKLMRLDNPVPIFLTYWPGAWAILGAASYLNTMPDVYLLTLFGLGAVCMRSAGCIVNDIWDRKIDRQVERTKNRPLASGAVGLPSALALLGANLSLSLAVLMQLDITTQVLGACCLFPVAIYPAAKRFTNWPQGILGVTFNWGALMGWSAVLCTSAVAPQNILAFLPAVALYAGAINWTLFYDTIYGFQDKIYDEKLGLKSTSITLQKHKYLWLSGFASLFGSNLALFGYLTAQEPIFYISLGAAMLHFVKQMAFVKENNPKSCMKQFKSNNTIGILVAFGLLANIYLKLN